MNFRRVAQNVLSNWLALITSAVTSFFLTPFIVGHLGNTDYGVWTLIVSVTGYLGLMDLGMRTAVVKYVSEFKAIGDDLMVNKIVSSSLYLFAALGLAIILVGSSAGFFFPYIFDLPASRWSEIRLVVVIASITFSVYFVASPLEGILWGVHRFDVLSGIRIVTTVLNALLIVWILSWRNDLIFLGLIGLGTATIGGVGTAISVRKLIRNLQVSKRLVNKIALRKLVNYGRYNFVISLGLRSISYTDLVLIGTIIGTTQVTFYGIAKSLIVYSEAIIAGLACTIMPRASELSASNEDVRALLKLYTRSCLIVGLPIFFVLIFLGKPFITLWMGPQYLASATVLFFLGIGGIANTFQFPLEAVLKGIGRVRFLAFAKAVEAALNLSLSLALIQTYGILGVAAGTAVASVCINLILIPAYVCKELKLKIQDLLSVTLPPVVSLIPCIVLVTFLPSNALDSSWGSFFAVAATIEILFFSVVAFSCFGKDERQACLRSALSVIHCR